MSKKERILKVLKKIGFWLLIAYVVLMIVRIPRYLEVKNTPEAVAKIHATKLTMDDVLGKNLPPDPGAEADNTVAGIDANKNGIRDDVELAIFKEYPDSAKTRAVLLQYALTLQMQMTMPILNEETVTASIEDTESRADVCLWSLSSRSDMDKFTADIKKYRNFIRELQVNTEKRKNYMYDFYKYMRSYSSSNEGCDLDVSLLTN